MRCFKQNRKIIAILGTLVFSCISAPLSDGARNDPNRPPTEIQQLGLYLSPGEGHWVQSKTDDGAIVILEDGSVWQIDPFDQIDTALWLPMTDITVVEIVGGYLLIDTDDGEKAHAKLLHQ
jgi:hypothetical protein